MISVILPLYNGKQFLKETVASVLDQTYAELELLVIDDGSTDGGRLLLPSDSRIHLFVRENSGVAATRNFGIRHARGALLAFIDQDDIWLPEKLAIQFDCLSRDPELDYTLTMMCNQLDENTSKPTWLEPEQLDKKQPGLLPSSLLARRRAFDSIGLFDEKLINASDLDWFIRADKAGLKRKLCEQVLLIRRIHETNASYNRQLSKKETFLILRRQIQARRKP
jgi:glycosyltransferase involved in cell wall biosynthesis